MNIASHFIHMLYFTHLVLTKVWLHQTQYKSCNKVAIANIHFMQEPQTHQERTITTQCVGTVGI